QPPAAEGVPAQGESGPAVGLPLCRSHGAVFQGMDGSAALATADPLSEAGRHVAGPPRRHPELLRDESPPGGGGSHQWKHQDSIAAWSRLQESSLPAAEGPTPGGNQDRIHGLQESRMNRTFYRIPAQSLKDKQMTESGAAFTVALRRID